MFALSFLAHIRLYSTNETASTPKPDKNKPAASDHSPESLGELVYTGNINKGVFVAKYFSVGSSVIGLCLTPWIVSEMSTGGLVFKIAVTTASGFFILVTPLLIHFLCKRYVVKMYYDKASSTFSAVKLNLLAQQRVFKFKPNEIKDSLTNPLCTVEVRDQGFLLDTDDLMNTNPDAYVAFMRYDQPIDLDKYTVDPKTGPSASDKKTVSGDDQ